MIYMLSLCSMIHNQPEEKQIIYKFEQRHKFTEFNLSVMHFYLV